MGIPLSTSFDVGTNLDLDSRKIKADVTARNAIASVGRYEGLEVFVVATHIKYRLQGGILDRTGFPLVENGEPALGNRGTTGFVLSSTTAGVRSWIAQSSYTLPATVVQTNQANTYQPYDQKFQSSNFFIMNPANTFGYVFYASAITAGRGITLPLLTSSDTLVTQDFAQTLTNKTIAYSSNTITGVEPALGNPGTNGLVLSSTTAGVRSWIAAGGGSSQWTTDTYGITYASNVGIGVASKVDSKLFMAYSTNDVWGAVIQSSGATAHSLG